MTLITRPSTPGEALAHFGIKGMHWGHHKPGEASSSAKPKKKKVTNDDIFNARDRQSARERKLDSLDDDYALATSAKGKAAAASMINKIGKEYVTGPDAKIAAKSTTGEKWVKGIMYTGLGALAILGGAGAIAGNTRHL